MLTPSFAQAKVQDNEAHTPPAFISHATTFFYVFSFDGRTRTDAKSATIRLRPSASVLIWKW